MGTSLEADRATANARRSPAAIGVVGAAVLVVFMVLVALGTWQVHRLSWKLDLIARVDQRVAAAPVAPPTPAAWPTVTAADDEYRHVRVEGRFLEGRDALVQAVTDFGGGYWVLVPFQTDTGLTVLVNRGFVPADLRDPASRRAGEIHGETAVTGLLRMSEPNGAFLRSNDAATDRWYSRDVAAIAAARHLGAVAPYFIDADATPNLGGNPIGGLTVIAFPNNHLVYAITWYGLAALLAGAAAWGIRDEWRTHKTDAAAPRTVTRDPDGPRGAQGAELGPTSVFRTRPGSPSRHGRPCAGHPRQRDRSGEAGQGENGPTIPRTDQRIGVDGRHKAGHDGEFDNPSSEPGPGASTS